jgi:uncharacterized protein (DUF488 family)
MPQNIFTVGYEKTTPEKLVELLGRRGVGVVVDVRLTPISRRKGFSKTALKDALAAAGIRYLHERRLGNPREFRVNARTIEECLDLYHDHMVMRWDEALADVMPLVEKKVCLLCLESKASECHRSVVAEELAARLPGAAVVNL